MFADIGYEETETKGLGWISGKVSKIDNLMENFFLLSGRNKNSGNRLAPLALLVLPGLYFYVS